MIVLDNISTKRDKTKRSNINYLGREGVVQTNSGSILVQAHPTMRKEVGKPT